MKEGFQYFEVRNSEIQKMYDLINQIKTRLTKNKQVLSGCQFSELILLLKPFIAESSTDLFIEIEKITTQIVNYCKKEKGYYFVDENNPSVDFPDSNHEIAKHELINDVRNEYMYISLRIMVNKAVTAAITFIDSTELDITNPKDVRKYTNDFIGVCYNTLQNYKIANFNKELKKQMSHYKLTVITGLIIIKLQPNLISKFEDVEIDNELLRPDDIKSVIVPYTNKFVKEYLLNK